MFNLGVLIDWNKVNVNKPCENKQTLIRFLILAKGREVALV